MKVREKSISYAAAKNLREDILHKKITALERELDEITDAKKKQKPQLQTKLDTLNTVQKEP